MNKNLTKLVELCDCDYLWGKWKKKKGDYLYSRTYKLVGVIYDIEKAVYPVTCVSWVSAEGTSDYQLVKGDDIWLPIGFNPESCRWQICLLLDEAIKLNDLDMVHRLNEIKAICLGGKQ